MNRNHSNYRDINRLWEKIIWSVFIFVNLGVPYLQRFSIYNMFSHGVRLMGLFYLLINIRYLRINALTIVLMAYNSSLLFSTYLYRSSVDGLILSYAYQVFFSLTVYNMLRHDSALCIDSLLLVFTLCILLNLLSMFLFPDGLYRPEYDVGFAKKYYFLGHQNGMGIYAIVAISLAKIKEQISSKMQNSKSFLFFLYIIIFFYVFRVWSALAIIGTVSLFVLYLINDARKNGLKISPVITIATNVFIFITIVLENNTGIFNTFINSVLHREATFSGRTYIWLKALNAFKSNVVWGIGEGQGLNLFGYNTAHNRYLNTLLTGGVVGFVLFIILIAIVYKKIDKDNSVNRIFSISLFVLLTLVQGETYSGLPFFIIFFLADGSKYLQPALTSAGKTNLKRVRLK